MYNCYGLHMDIRSLNTFTHPDVTPGPDGTQGQGLRKLTRRAQAALKVLRAEVHGSCLQRCLDQLSTVQIRRRQHVRSFFFFFFRVT